MGIVKKWSNFVIRRIKNDDIDAVVRVLGNAFMSEPMTLSHKDIRLEENEHIVRLLSDNYLSDDLTLIVETTDKRAAGVATALDFATVPPAEFLDYSINHRHFSTVMKIIKQLEEHYSKTQGFEHGSMPKGHSVHIFMIGIDPTFRQMGISGALLGASLEHYKSKNYRFAMAEATSLFMRKALYKFGFESVLRLPYAPFFPGGEMEKLIADGHDAAHLMVKELK